MDRETVKKSFIDAAIKIAAEKGMNAITSRSLESVSNTNQYYLYRVFDSVDDVIVKASIFARDTFINLGYECMKIYEGAIDKELSEEECQELDKAFFSVLWEGFKKDNEIYTFYVRFYYNYVYPDTYSTDEAKIDYKPFLRVMSPLFKEDTDLMVILMMLMETLSRFAAKVSNGELDDSKETDALVFNHVFKLLYPYLKFADFELKIGLYD